MLVAISDLNQTASLDKTLSSSLHYVAMVCKCYLLLNKVNTKIFSHNWITWHHMMQVKLALSQDIVLTTISPQRSVMATAVHNLQEVNKFLSYITVSILRLNGVAVNLKRTRSWLSTLWEVFRNIWWWVIADRAIARSSWSPNLSLNVTCFYCKNGSFVFTLRNLLG